MVVYQRPGGKPSLTNPDYPIYSQKCGGKLDDSDHDAAVELYKGVSQARDLLAIGARSPVKATEKALGAFPITAKGRVSVCPRCQKWSLDFHGDAARLQKAVQRFHEVLVAGSQSGSACGDGGSRRHLQGIGETLELADRRSSCHGQVSSVLAHDPFNQWADDAARAIARRARIHAEEGRVLSWVSG
jgi:hypothetical protein